MAESYYTGLALAIIAIGGMVFSGVWLVILGGTKLHRKFVPILMCGRTAYLVYLLVFFASLILLLFSIPKMVRFYLPF